MPDPIVIPDRQLLTCRRRLAFHRRSATPDPGWDGGYDQTKGEADRALHKVIAAYMTRQGWQLEIETGHRRRDFNGAVIRGGPDAVGRHPDITEGKPTPALMQIATAASVKRQIRMTLPLARPALAARAAVHHQAIVGDADPEAPPAVIATMNADTRQIGMDYLHPETVANLNDDVARWIQPMLSTDPDTLPDPDYYPDSLTCQRCPFLVQCHGPRTEPQADDEPAVDLDEACRRYAAAKAETDLYAEAEKRRKTAQDDIKRILAGKGLAEYRHEGEQPLTVKMTDTTSYTYNRKLMAQFLTPEQLGQVIKENRSQRINISLA